ncbi:uncharacterized protein LOC132732069 [Ruditapes philippinarum]|uniref:uncharacterized protein LOC132732069 n=1 Tax=Ruditapes philippinarum TaxID=129788 RepID=UPI00295C0FA8|nr:uncharacterized protein LOC132732069 [Ruditapes philippinarum]
MDNAIQQAENNNVVVGLIVIFVLIGCSLSVGYSIGNNACEKREKNHFHRHDESRFKKTTKLSTLPNRVSTKSNDLETTTSLISITNSTTPEKTTRISGTIVRTSNCTIKQRPPIKVNLDGQTYRLSRQSDGKHWQYDESNQQCVSGIPGIRQPLDSFTKFKFVKMNDGSYKIMSKCRKVFLFDGFGVSGAHSRCLNGKQNPDDNRMRFRVTMETQNLCRIRTKATGRFLRMDEDLHVSSIKNISDCNSLFRLEKVR